MFCPFEESIGQIKRIKQLKPCISIYSIVQPTKVGAWRRRKNYLWWIWQRLLLWWMLNMFVSSKCNGLQSKSATHFLAFLLHLFKKAWTPRGYTESVYVNVCIRYSNRIWNNQPVSLYWHLLFIPLLKRSNLNKDLRPRQLQAYISHLILHYKLTKQVIKLT